MRFHSKAKCWGFQKWNVWHRSIWTKDIKGDTWSVHSATYSIGNRFKSRSYWFQHGGLFR